MTYRTIRHYVAADLDDQEMRRQVDERIKPLITRWPHQMGLGFWHLSYEYARNAAEDDDHRDVNQWGTLAEVRCDWRYKQAYFTFFMPQVLQADDSELEYAFVHEHCHVLVNELRGTKLVYKADSTRTAHEESVVTGLAKAFLWVRDSAIDYPTHWCDCVPDKEAHHDQEGDPADLIPRAFEGGETSITTNGLASATGDVPEATETASPDAKLPT